MNLLVAEKVLGWHKGRPYGNGNGEWIRPGVKSDYPLTWNQTPDFSTDIGKAWALIDGLTQATSPHGERWSVHISKIKNNYRVQVSKGCCCHGVEVESTDAAFAICQAALKAVAQ